MVEVVEVKMVEVMRVMVMTMVKIAMVRWWWNSCWGTGNTVIIGSDSD